MPEARRAIPVLGLLADAGRVYARHWPVLVPLALLILLPQAVLDAVDVDLGVEVSELSFGRLVGGGAALAGVLGIGLAGEAFYAGVITALVLCWRRGEPRIALSELARSLPYVRLIVADALFVVGTAVGVALLVVPGVVFATYFLLTPVLIELERGSVRDGLRRSAALVRGSFWRTLAVVAIALGGTEAAIALLEIPLRGFAAEVGANLALGALLEPLQGVATVLLALELMEVRGEEPRHPVHVRREGGAAPSRGRDR